MFCGVAVCIFFLRNYKKNGLRAREFSAYNQQRVLPQISKVYIERWKFTLRDINFCYSASLKAVTMSIAKEEHIYCLWTHRQNIQYNFTSHHTKSQVGFDSSGVLSPGQG